MNLQKLRSMEYEKCAGLLAKLLDLGEETKEEIHDLLQSTGIRSLLLNFESLDLSPETIEKLISVKDIVGIYEGQRG